jgi:hypothetical protein
MSKSDAERIIPKSERDHYIEWMRSSVQEYAQGYTPKQRLIHTKGARAHVIHSHIVDRVAREFDAIHGAHVQPKRGRHLLIVADTHVGWFKKLDDRRRPRYIRTSQSVRYAGQLRLIGVPEPTHLILGYQLNAVGTDCSAIYIICPDGDKIAWEWQIWGAEPATLPVTATVDSPAPGASGTRIVPRTGLKAVENETDA